MYLNFQDFFSLVKLLFLSLIWLIQPSEYSSREDVIKEMLIGFWNIFDSQYSQVLESFGPPKTLDFPCKYVFWNFGLLWVNKSLCILEIFSIHHVLDRNLVYRSNYREVI